MPSEWLSIKPSILSTNPGSMPAFGIAFLTLMFRWPASWG